MPIYEYKCPNCGWVKEIIKRMSDDLTVLCEKCSKVMKIQIQPVSFKIGGWFTSKNGYSKNEKYMEAVEKKKKALKKKGL